MKDTIPELNKQNKRLKLLAMLLAIISAGLVISMLMYVRWDHLRDLRVIDTYETKLKYR